MAVTREPRLSPEAWASARRVLVVRPDGLGDLLMTAPAIAALRAAGPPDRHVTLLTTPSAVAVAELLPAIDDAFGWDVPWVNSSEGSIGDDLRLLSRLTVGRFDAAVVFTTATQSALPAATLLRLAGIPSRAAFSRENPYGILTDWVPEPEPHGPARHEVRRQLDLVRHLGASSADASALVRISDDVAARASGILARAGIRAGDRWLVVHPGASAAARRYAPGSYAAAADRLVAEGWRIVVTGTERDREVVDEMVTTMVSHGEVVDLVGVLDLPTLAAVLRSAAALISNNTGPAHLAAAVGTPVVDLYALTNPQHAPWGARHRLLFRDVPCRNCFRSVCTEGHHLCLAGVSSDEVVEAFHEVVA